MNALSTKKLGALNNYLGTSTVRCSKYYDMHSEQTLEKESLGDYVRRVAHEKNLTFREVARRGGISAPSISDIVSGKTREVRSGTIAALARGLDVSEDEVFAIVSGRTPEEEQNYRESRFALLSLKFDRLPPDKRVNVEALIELLDRELERLGKK